MAPAGPGGPLHGVMLSLTGVCRFVAMNATMTRPVAMRTIATVRDKGRVSIKVLALQALMMSLKSLVAPHAMCGA